MMRLIAILLLALPLSGLGQITNFLDNIHATNIAVESFIEPNITFNQLGAGAYPPLGPAALAYSQLADYPGGSQDPGFHFTDTVIFHSYTLSGISFIAYGQVNFFGDVVALHGTYWGDGSGLTNVPTVGLTITQNVLLWTLVSTNRYTNVFANGLLVASGAYVPPAPASVTCDSTVITCDDTTVTCDSL
jgi:hypothetical protein